MIDQIQGGARASPSRAAERGSVRREPGWCAASALGSGFLALCGGDVEGDRFQILDELDDARVSHVGAGEGAEARVDGAWFRGRFGEGTGGYATGSIAKSPQIQEQTCRTTRTSPRNWLRR